MFRHKGEARTIYHNLLVASLLSFVAGIVNVAGFLSVHRLTTNVTGHFAFFVEEVLTLNLVQGFVFFLFIFFFFLGSFSSSFIVELGYKRKGTYNFVGPVLLEAISLIAIGIFGSSIIGLYADALAFVLLFVMGFQNSLVTTISNSVVRTTHLTGLFTDLGIELSQLFFYVRSEQRAKLISSINLRLTIIGFFFIGGMVGGIFYSGWHLYVLIFAGATLILGLTYDYVKHHNKLSSHEMKE